MAKRSNGEGSYKKLPSGKWSAQLMVGYTDEGKRRIKTFTAPTKSEVKRKIEQYFEDLAVEKEQAKTLSFSEWADIWYADHKSEVEKSTYWSYSFTLKTLKDYFGDRPVSEIKQLDINRFLDVLVERKRSKSTIAKCKSMLFQIFASAADNDLVTKNPVVRAKKVKKAAKEGQKMNKRSAFSQEEVEIMKRDLPNNLLGNSILTLIGTGMRVQELLALTKDDIAPDGSFIRVDKAVKMAYRMPSLGAPKSEKSNRGIPVAKEYRPYALYLREHGGSKYIWTSSRENGLYTVEEFRNRYKCAMKKLSGVTYRTPHCCRHTYITNLEARHVPMELISALAGHEDSTTTLSYTHISLETLRKVVEGL